MAKYDLKFIDFIEGKDSISVVNVNLNGNDLIRISLRRDLPQMQETCNDIILDKSTAIKFAKTLRTEINKINTIE